ncbi:hypothetical protein CKC_03390 [Candidatus Liberibacter solanacearum CLso-ZC1]|uniref:Uncharacterized protein n=1 Tax=Liberibacter solanacearum (strain CLso-ZC1) TaxID=658172 RepID=E4UB36_LIBSC|nr:hypothetical protein CKC_03390 [Candidatus Liberibacter solanacearum CLso-ZC1]
MFTKISIEKGFQDNKPSVVFSQSIIGIKRIRMQLMLINGGLGATALNTTVGMYAKG